MSLLNALILGIIQGVAEFLPISSSLPSLTPRQKLPPPTTTPT